MHTDSNSQPDEASICLTLLAHITDLELNQLLKHDWPPAMD